MSVWQVWLLVGVPALAIALACFARGSRVLWLVGLVVLVVGCAGVMAVSPASGAAFGGLLALLYATGRGSGKRPRESADAQEAAPDDGYSRQP